MEKSMLKYRHELKYRIGISEYMSIASRLRVIMKYDRNADTNGRYVIRSIYFDNITDKALREKKDGVSRREKFRIRYYNDNLSYIVLEKKVKKNNKCLKYKVRITEEECRKILDGDTKWMLDSSEDLMRELYCKMKSQQLKPRIMVSYTREAYTYCPGNVRITFDSEIRSTMYHQNFLCDDISDISVLETPGQMIMEIKYDEFLPEIIRCLIQSEGVRQVAFSKYGICRKFG